MAVGSPPPPPTRQLCTTVPLSPPTPFSLHAQLMDMGGMHAALWSGADHAAVQCPRKHFCVWARADRREKGETIIIINAMTRDRDLQCKPGGVALLDCVSRCLMARVARSRSLAVFR